MLLKGRGGRSPVQHNFHQLAANVRTLSTQALPAARKEALNAVGVKVLAWGIQDFREKSKGGTAGGVKWLPLTEGAIVTRLSKRAPWQNLQKQKRALAGTMGGLDAEIAQLSGFLRRGVQVWKKGRQRINVRAKLKALQAKRAALNAKRDAMVAKEKSGAKIGIDTGRLVGSLKSATGATGPTGPDQVFIVRDSSVAVGAQVDYAGHFDKLRPIFGDAFLSGSRLQELENLSKRIYETAVKKGLGI